MAINQEGYKDLLGLWIDQTEGATFWLQILNEIRIRGMQDILFTAVNGFFGFCQPIAKVFSKVEVQLCIVHMFRNSSKFVPLRDRKAIAVGLRKIYAVHRLKSCYW